MLTKFMYKMFGFQRIRFNDRKSAMPLVPGLVLALQVSSYHVTCVCVRMYVFDMIAVVVTFNFVKIFRWNAM